MTCLATYIDRRRYCNKPERCYFCPVNDTEPDCWRGVQEVLWRVEYELPNGHRFICKPGFCFDAASIPQAAWSIIGSPQDFVVEALMHDLAYSTHLITKQEADDGFRQLLKQAGYSLLKRATMHRAVQAFGSRAWRKPDAYIQHFRQFAEIR